ncbi:MAG TPA: serine/threonine-protein kinase [Polyangia bacterium]|nr:serine/threonine-protein kinase [Polyangia bacterium]
MLPKITPPPEDDFDKTRALAPQQATAMIAEVDPDELRPGTMAGAYVLEKSLASGGGGTVYEARHRLLGRTAAVKILRRELATSPRMVARFLREALAVNLIKHPAIVDIYEFGEMPDGRPYYVMELLSGTDLRSLLSERGRFEPREVLAILEPVCSALSAAHAQGIVHRDLKASNIHVEMTADGERKVKLLDFGIAKLLRPEDEEAGLTVAGARLGTSYTMAPEQIRCDTIDGRTDVYALGVVLYHLLAGQYPFRGEFMTDIERMHLEAPVPRVSQVVAVPPALDAVIMKAMEKQRDRRFQDPEAFIAALRAAIAPGASTGTEQGKGRAMAIYVDVRVPEDADSDEILDDVSAVLDTAESMLRDDGWQVLLQTGNTLLGAKVLPDDAAYAAATCAAGQVTAEGLVEALAARDTATAEVKVNVSIHVDDAILKGAGHDSEIVGGALTSVSGWAPEEHVEGLYTSPAFATVTSSG